MKLRKVKAFGFKTFAEPTTLDFTNGITAIVGPNGSGKSSLLRAAAGQLGAVDAPALALPDAPLIDALSGTVEDRLATLAGCGSAVSEPPRAAIALPAEPAMARPPAAQPLTGLSAAEVVALLGEPDFRRAEPPAELWQYRSADCVLDLFLYGDAAGARVVIADAGNVRRSNGTPRIQQ